MAGWTFPTPTARKAHYFPADDARSLCGKYMLLFRDNRQMGEDIKNSPDDCVACRRKREAASA